jgi:hypothetical protein
MIDKLHAINFVKHYLDEVSLVLDGLKHQQRLGDCFKHAVHGPTAPTFVQREALICALTPLSFLMPGAP